MNMYYDDLTEMWSSSSNLVDNAALLYEQEHSLADKGKSKRRTKKTVSREEEEDEERANNSFFHLFPRKSRSSMKKHVPRRDPQNPLQNPNGASTSSSLFDVNIIAADSETKDPQNPPSEPSSTPLLVDYNTAESEKTETKNPPNPKSQSPPSSCLTENTSRKRCAVEQNGAFKVMRSMNGGAYDPRLIFEKTLFMTDVNPGQSRLSIPFNNLIRNDFLTPLESRIIEEDINNNEKMGVGAILVDQRTVKWGVILKRWEMKKDSGNRSWNYALICGWNDIVKANGLKDGDNISLWSFRCRGILCFALVPTPVGRSSSYLKVFLSNNFSEL